MLVVVADDQEPTLKLVQRWFEKKYAKGEQIRLETHGELENLEEFIKSKLIENDKLLVLLDLDWQADKKRALEWLGRIKASATTQHWPILIYSESQVEEDVNAAHDSLANGYVHKGEDRQAEHFIEVLEHWRNKQLLPIG